MGLRICFGGEWFLVGKGSFSKDEEAGGRHIEDCFWRAVFGRCGLVAGWLRKDHRQVGPEAALTLFIIE